MMGTPGAGAMSSMTSFTARLFRRRSDFSISEYVVTDVRPSRSRPGVGIVTCEVKAVNQDGEVVQHGVDVLLIGSRPDAAA